MTDRRYDLIIQKMATLINQNIRRELDERDRAVAGLQAEVAELTGKLGEALSQLAEVRQRLASIERQAASHSPRPLPAVSDSGPSPGTILQWAEENGGQELTASVKKLVDDYNRAVGRPAAENAFRDKYGPDRVEVANLLDRIINPGLPPIFTKGGGDYWAIRSKTQSHYLVLPRLNLLYEEETHEAGAMSLVFNVNGFAAGQTYPRFLLLRPAIFAEEEQHNLVVVEKGALQLEPAETAEPAAASEAG